MNNPVEPTGEVIECNNVIEVPLKRREISKNIDFKDVPQVIKDALGLKEGQKEYGNIIENDPDVAAKLDAIKKMTDQVEPLATIVTGTIKGPDLGVTVEAREKRNNIIVDLASMGLTYKTILNNINERNKLEQWGHIEGEKSIRRIITDYYMSMKPSASEDMCAYDDSMREAAYVAQDKVIEKLALLLRKEGTFKTDFERSIALEKLINAHQLRIENRGFNRSRATPFSAQQTINNVNIINQHVNNVAIEGNKENVVHSLLSTIDKILGD